MRRLLATFVKIGNIRKYFAVYLNQNFTNIASNFTFFDCDIALVKHIHTKRER